MSHALRDHSPLLPHSLFTSPTRSRRANPDSLSDSHVGAAEAWLGHSEVLATITTLVWGKWRH